MKGEELVVRLHNTSAQLWRNTLTLAAHMRMRLSPLI